MTAIFCAVALPGGLDEVSEWERDETQETTVQQW